MTTLYAATHTLLTNDATLAALATGGVHDVQSLGRQELELADITAGTPLVKPAVFLRWTTETEFVRVINARRVYLDIYVYQDTGYLVTAQMRDRIFTLLHQQRVTFTEPAGDYLYAFVWAGDVVQQQDDTLGGASMERSRYEGHLTKG